MTIWVCSICSKLGLAEKKIELVEYFNAEGTQQAMFLCGDCLKKPGLFAVAKEVPQETKVEQAVQPVRVPKQRVKVEQPEPVEEVEDELEEEEDSYVQPPLPSEVKKKRSSNDKPKFRTPTPEEIDNMPLDDEEDEGVFDI